MKKKNKAKMLALPCNVGDSVYGVKCCCPLDSLGGGISDIALLNYCRKVHRQCSKCKYSEPCVEAFICTEIRIERNNRIHICGNNGEKYLAEFVFDHMPNSKEAKQRIQPKFIDDYMEGYYDGTCNVAK